MHRPRRLPPLVALAAALLATPAAAEPPQGRPADEADQEPGAGVARPAAPDNRTGHVYLGVSGNAVGPGGSMGPNTATRTLAGAGFGFGGFVGVGVGRYGTVQIFGDSTTFFSPGACSARCGGRSYSLGLGVTYHVAQGIAFDPWISYGLAYRYSSFQVIDPAGGQVDPATGGILDRVTQTYHGIDIARIAFGGDWYPTPAFGFGPFLEVDLGTNFKRPDLLQPLPPGVTDTARAYAMFQIGVRIAFDPLRRAAAPAPTTVGGPSARQPTSF